VILLANPTDGSLWMFQDCLQVQGLDTSNPPNGSWGIVQAQPRDAAPRLEFASSITCYRFASRGGRTLKFEVTAIYLLFFLKIILLLSLL
jgi:hypothetical protein